MMRFALLGAPTLFVALTVPAAAADLDVGLNGTITTSVPTPVPGVQTFNLSGGFTSYSASPDLPQITGGDLNAYSFNVTGLSQAYDDLTRTVTYGNVTGTISGYGQVVQYLAPTTLTVVFDPTFATASVFGTLMSTGPVSPAGFPGPIDFSPANGATISGTYTSFGVPGQGGSFVGAISTAAAAVPEPATWAMMLLGFGAMGAAMRRKQALAVRYAF